MGQMCLPSKGGPPCSIRDLYVRLVAGLKGRCSSVYGVGVGVAYNGPLPYFSLLLPLFGKGADGFVFHCAGQLPQGQSFVSCRLPPSNVYLFFRCYGVNE